MVDFDYEDTGVRKCRRYLRGKKREQHATRLFDTKKRGAAVVHSFNRRIGYMRTEGKIMKSQLWLQKIPSQRRERMFESDRCVIVLELSPSQEHHDGQDADLVNGVDFG